MKNNKRKLIAKPALVVMAAGIGSRYGGLKHKRYRIETVIGQLVDRFHAKKIWARDAWHLISCWSEGFKSHNS